MVSADVYKIEELETSIIEIHDLVMCACQVLPGNKELIKSLSILLSRATVLTARQHVTTFAVDMPLLLSALVRVVKETHHEAVTVRTKPEVGKFNLARAWYELFLGNDRSELAHEIQKYHRLLVRLILDFKCIPEVIKMWCRHLQG